MVTSIVHCCPTYLSGSNCVKVWDVLSGGRLLMVFSNHQKTITDMCFDGNCQRLFSGGLDKWVFQNWRMARMGSIIVMSLFLCQQTAQGVRCWGLPCCA